MHSLVSGCTIIIIVALGSLASTNGCGENEISRWGVNYSDDCFASQYNLTEIKHGCYCKHKYKRNSDGKCVLEKDCPTLDNCDADEVIRWGIRHSDSCFYKHHKSTDIIYGCFCRDTYKRDESRRCIPKQKCPKEKYSCKDNEIERWGIKASDDCNYIHKEGDDIIYGCFCNDDYRRNQNGTCILKEKCTPEVKCKLNEEFRCSYGCEATCYTIGKICRKKHICVDGCYCIKGYAKNPDGVCISNKECAEITTIEPLTQPTMSPIEPAKICKNENEEYRCSYGCKETCETWNEKCIPHTTCINDCYCKKEYVRSSNGTCILISDCIRGVNNSSTIKPTTSRKLVNSSKIIDNTKESAEKTVTTSTRSSISTKIGTTPLSTIPIDKSYTDSISSENSSYDDKIQTQNNSEEDLQLVAEGRSLKNDSQDETSDVLNENLSSNDSIDDRHLFPINKLDKSSISDSNTSDCSGECDSDTILPFVPNHESHESTTKVTTMALSSSTATKSPTISTDSAELLSNEDMSENKIITTTDPSSIAIDISSTISTTKMHISHEDSKADSLCGDSCEDQILIPTYLDGEKSVEFSNSGDKSESSNSVSSSDASECNGECDSDTIIPFVPTTKSNKLTTTSSSVIEIAPTKRTTTMDISNENSSLSTESHSCGDSCEDGILIPKNINEDSSEEEHPSSESGNQKIKIFSKDIRANKSDSVEMRLLGEHIEKDSTELTSDAGEEVDDTNDLDRMIATRFDENSSHSEDCGSKGCESDIMHPVNNHVSEEDSAEGDQFDNKEDGSDNKESCDSGGCENEVLHPREHVVEDSITDESTGEDKNDLNDGSNEESCDSDGCEHNVVHPRMHGQEDLTISEEDCEGEDCNTKEDDESDIDKCLNCDNNNEHSTVTKKPKVPSCTRPNEEYKCNFGCEVTCGSYGKPCRTISKICKDGCFCISGFARNSEGICIPIKECNATRTNSSNLSTTTAVHGNGNNSKECSGHCESETVIPFISKNKTNISTKKKMPSTSPLSDIIITTPISTTTKKRTNNFKILEEDHGSCDGSCESGVIIPTNLHGHSENVNDTLRHNTTMEIDSEEDCGSKHCEENMLHPVSNQMDTEEYESTGEDDDDDENISNNEDDCDSDGCENNIIHPRVSDNDSSEEVSETHESNDDKCIECAHRVKHPLFPKPTKKPKVPKCTRPNEEYKCNYGCEVTCGSFGKPCRTISNTCKDGCFCIDKFARNADGICIPIDQCNQTITTTPHTTTLQICPGQHEKSKLVCETPCSKMDLNCTMEKNCKNICVCEEGYKRCSHGTCKPIESEEITTPKSTCPKSNEEYKCSYGCEPICSKRIKSCNKSKNCTFSCVCKTNFIRHMNGNCIPVEECAELKKDDSNACPKPNEEYKCSYGCEMNCGTLHEKCKKSKKCSKGCYCLDNYARNSTGICVPIEACNRTTTESPVTEENKCSRAHEEYKFNFGCELTCAANGIECINRSSFGYGCACALNYIRDLSGNCIPSKECTHGVTTNATICKKPFEIATCSYGCEPTCRSLGQSCNVSKECEHGCFCVHGYARNSNGDCIRIKDCIIEDLTITTTEAATTPTSLKKHCLKQHEEFKCSYGCEPTYPPSTKPCKRMKFCKHGCVCVIGYARSSNGDCVNIKDFFPTESGTTQTHKTTIKNSDKTKCNKPNEEYRCSYGCEATCLNYANICIKKSKKCISGCYCKNGYAKDSNGLCIPIWKCHPELVTTSSIAPITVPELELVCSRPNEHLECGSNCQPTCENYHKSCPITNMACKKGCYCNKGYARDSTKTCVPIKVCTDRQNGICGIHEEYRLDSFVYNECITPSVYTITKTYGCYCIKGYKRNSSGKCIPVNQCPPINGIICTGDYEHYECGSACQTTCKNYNKTCPITKIHCIKGCYCNFGYARNDKGICIPLENCNKPSSDHCPKYEEYKYDSPTKYNCVQDYSRRDYKRILACHCINGYKRDCAGHCVPKDECPVSCKICGENEEYRYDIDTSPTHTRCNKYKVLKCHCIKGFRYDNRGKCVPDSGETCKTNEIYSFDNYNNNACAADFHNPENSLNVYSCHCKEGYKRHKSGYCVKEHECPEEILANCTRPNEQYECGSPCQKTCGNYMKPCRIKSDGCVKGCYCKTGYARDCTGTCIKIEHCLLRENGICGKKEEYRLDSFINNECASNPDNTLTSPPLYGCYCIIGYKRNSKGDCISENKCL